VSHSLVSLWTETRKRLEAAGVDSPVLDARLLLEAGAGVARLDIITDPRRTLSEAQVEAVLALCARREAREPVSQILGRKAFWTLDLIVNSNVLTPRPETEFVVEAALSVMPKDEPLRVLDVGVGSGAILLAILAERPHARGVGVDISAAALDVAIANADRVGVADRAHFVQSRWTEAVEGAFDIVVSNPPYIPSSEIAQLAPEVARYEPVLALDGGADGLDAYRALFAAAPSVVAPGGFFAFEVGKGQFAAVAALACESGFVNLTKRDDLAGVRRVLSGQRFRAETPVR
jgi:release factor glutamine methyltransferase